MSESRFPRMPQRRLSVLFLLSFLVFILAEVALLVWVTNLIGWWTLVALMASTVVGAFLLQREWRKAWRGLSESLQTGSLPAGRTADAVLVLLGGFMLIMPGFGSDIIGLLLLLPFTRPGIRSILGWWVGRTVAGNATSPRDTVIRGDVVDSDDAGPRTGTVMPEIRRDEDERRDAEDS